RPPSRPGGQPGRRPTAPQGGRIATSPAEPASGERHHKPPQSGGAQRPPAAGHRPPRLATATPHPLARAPGPDRPCLDERRLAACPVTGAALNTSGHTIREGNP